MTLRHVALDRLPAASDRSHDRARARLARLRPAVARVAVAWVVVGTLASACGGSPATQPTSLTPSEIRERANQPLTLLGPCTFTPTPADIGEVPGLLVPDEAVIVDRTDTEGLVNIRGYVPMTPVQVRLWYEDTAATTDVEILSSEDETQEAEVLVDVGDHRLYIKAAALCELGSQFIVVIAPTGSPAAVPTPTGTAAAPE